MCRAFWGGRQVSGLRVAVSRWALGVTSVLLAALAVGGLAACMSGGATPTPAGTPEAAALPVTPLPTPSGPITLTYWEEDSNTAVVLLDALAAEFMQANPDVVVSRQHYGYDELRNQFRAAAFRGEAPTLVRAPGEFAGPFGELDIVRPLDELFSAEYLEQFSAGALGGATVLGKLWGVPDNFGNHLMLLYNKALVSQLPANTDEWIRQLRALTDAANGQYGLAYPIAESYWLMPWLTGFGSWPLDAQGRVTLDTAEMIEALWFAHDLKYQYGVMPGDASYAAAFEAFSQGRAAYIIDGAWNLDRYQGLGVDAGVAMLPKISQTGLAAASLATGRYWFIAKTSTGPELDAAARFIEFMTSAEAQQRWLADLRRLPSVKQPELLWDAVAAARGGQSQEPNAAPGEQSSVDALMAGILAELRVARGVPPALEMACVWQGIDAYLPAVMAGQLSPDEAPPQMQARAEACVADMGGYLTPTP